MKEFKIGQIVRVSNIPVAEEYCIPKRFFGTELEIKEIVYPANYFGSYSTIVDGYYIPPEACELIKDIEDKQVAYVLVASDAKLFEGSPDGNKLLFLYSTQKNAQDVLDNLEHNLTNTIKIKRWTIIQEDV
jgi:hypothetical protein